MTTLLDENAWRANVGEAPVSRPRAMASALIAPLAPSA